MATIQSKLVQLIQESPAVRKAAKEVYGGIEEAAEYLGRKFSSKEDVKLTDIAVEIAEQKKLKDIPPEEALKFDEAMIKEGLPVEKGGLPAVIDKKRGKTSEAITPEVIEAPAGKEQLRLPSKEDRGVIELGGDVDTGIEPRAKIVSDDLRSKVKRGEEQLRLSAPKQGPENVIPLGGRADDGIEPAAKIQSKREGIASRLEEKESSPVSFLDKLRKNKKEAATAMGLTGLGLGAVAGRDGEEEASVKKDKKPKSAKLFDDESIKLEEAKREKAQKKRERAVSNIKNMFTEAYDTVSEGFKPSREKTENLIKYLRRSGGKANLERADALEAKLNAEIASEKKEVASSGAQEPVETPAAVDEKPTTLLGGAQKARADKISKPTKQPEEAATKPAKTLKEAIGKPAQAAPTPSTEVETAEPATPKSIQATLQEQLAGLEARRQEAKSERDAKRKRADWGELASIIGRSLAQIGAAAQGLKSGVDMSNVVGPAIVNWEKQRDRIDNDYVQEIKELEGQSREATRLAERAEDKETRERYRKEDFENQKEIANLKYTNKLRGDNAKSVLNEAKAVMSGKAQSFNNNIKAQEDLVQDYERELKNLNKVKASIAANDDKNAIIKLATPILGDLVEKDKYFGVIDSTKSKEEINSMADARIEALNTAIEQAKKSIDRQRKYLVQLKSTTPERFVQQGGEPAQAPATPEAPVKAITSAQLSQVAQRDGISEDEARKKLEMLGYTIRD